MVVGAQRAEGSVDGEADHCILCAARRIGVHSTVNRQHCEPASPRFRLIALQHLLLSIIYLQMMQNVLLPGK